MRLPNDFPVQQSAGFQPGFVWRVRKRATACLQTLAGTIQVAWLPVKSCLLLLSSVILGLAATMATACLGQEFTPLPGPPGVGSGPGFPMPLNQQPGLGPPVITPGSGLPMPLNQQPGLGPPVITPGPGLPMPSNQGPGPGFPNPQNQQPGLGAPVVEPGAWPPVAPAAGSEQPPVTAGPGPGSQGNGNDAGEFGDMMGFGGMGGMGGMGGFGGGMNPVDSVRYAVIWFPKCSRPRTVDRL